MKRLRLWFMLVVLLLCTISATSAQSPRIITRTRLQAIFSDLEGQWLKAIQNKDEAALDQLLADGFEVWTPTQGDPIPREDWAKKAFARKLQSFQLRQLAVRGVDPEVSVANFILTETFDEAGKSQSEDYFVIDLWVKDGDSWRCTDRYWSRVPGGPPAKRDVKPTGKE
jgi:ketosteroid isomerase-like protein